MTTQEFDWRECFPRREIIFLSIDYQPEPRDPSIDPLVNAAICGFEEAKIPFGNQFAATVLEVISLRGQEDSARARGPRDPVVRVVAQFASGPRDDFEIYGPILQTLSPELVKCVFRDTFRNLFAVICDEREANAQLYRSLRHQFGNHLFRISARLEQAGRLLAQSDMEGVLARAGELVAGAERSAVRAGPMLQNLAILGGERTRFHLKAIRPSVGEAIARFKVLAAEWGVPARIKGGREPGGESDPHLVHALWVILENALQAQLRRPGGAVEVEITEDSNRLLVRVRDSGPGIDMDAVSGIRGVAWRAESFAGRTGLGLSASSRIIEAYRGRLRGRRVPQGGSEFLVELPLEI